VALFWRKREDPAQRELSQRLTALPLFQGLERSALDALVQELEWLAMPGGTVLFEQGESSDSLYVLLYGRLLAERQDRSGRWQPVGSIGAGETVGEAGLLAGEPRTARVTALRDCELLRLSEQALERVSMLHPQPMLRMARLALRRYARSRQETALPTCFAVLPASRGVDLEGFARELLAQLGDTDPEAALIRASEGAGRDHAWFAEREASLPRLLYLGDGEAGWRERCVRQSDHVLLLADARRPLDRDALLPVPPLHEQVPQLLVLLQDGEPRPGSTRPWLEAFPSARRVAHLRGAADLARLARRLSGRATGLVLSGGGARGFAHLGAARALRESGMQIDAVGGCSIGAIMGAGIAADWDFATLREVYHRAFVLGKPVRERTLPLMSLYSGHSITRLLRAAFGERDIEDLLLPYYCVSSDLTEGRLKVHERGRLWQWLKATSAIPGILPPVFTGGRVLVDGGVIDNLPVREMRQRLQGEIVAVDAGADLALQTTLEEFDAPPWWRLLGELFGERRHPRMTQILQRAGMVNSDATARRWRHYADLMVAPRLPAVDLLDWSAFDRAIEEGYRAAMEALETGARADGGAAAVHESA
jgi:NTE family protein